MSKKAKTYFLIVLIILSWGYVGFKIYNALQGDDEQVLNLEKTEIKKINKVVKGDSIVLLLNYPDPFLKNGSFSKPVKINSSENHTSSPKTEKPTTSKPKQNIVPVTLDIKYVGLVKNSVKGTSTAMIAINGKSSFVKQNDVIEGYILQEISNDLIKLKKGKEVLIINK